MALQLGALREALVDAGASPEKAARAAEELAGYQTEFLGLRTDIAELRAYTHQQIGDLRAHTDQQIVELRAHTHQQIAELHAHTDQEFAKVRGDINLLRWMAGTNIVLTAGVLFRLLTH